VGFFFIHVLFISINVRSRYTGNTDKCLYCQVVFEAGTQVTQISVYTVKFVFEAGTQVTQIGVYTVEFVFEAGTNTYR